MFGRIAAYISLAILSASCATKAVEQEEVVSIPVEPYVPTWKCIDCTPEEQFVLSELQDKTRITDKMPWQRYWETLNRKVSSIPTFAREGLEFLTLIVIGVGTDSFSGPLRTVIWG